MYLLTTMITFAILYFFTLFGAGSQRVLYFIDLPSLVVPILVCIPILVSCGLHKDFLHAFRLVSIKQPGAGLKSIKRAKEAVSLVMKTLLVTGGFITTYSFIVILADEGNREILKLDYLLIMSGVALISLFYSFALTLFLLPLYQRLKLMILEQTER